MEKIARFIDKCSGFGGAIAGLMLCAGLGLIIAEIILRSCFNSTLYITNEYAGYLMSGLTLCALSYTLRDRAHIRMTFLHRTVTGKARLYLDLACFAAGLVFSIGLAWFTVQLFWDSVSNQTQSMQISQTYLAIPQFFMPFGALLLSLQFFSEILKTLLALRSGAVDIAIDEAAQNLGR